MKVELSIKDDKELRNLIKDMIKGQVVSVTRQEIHKIISEVIGEQVNCSIMKSIDSLIKDEVRAIVKDILKRKYAPNYSGFIEEYARECINERLNKISV